MLGLELGLGLVLGLEQEQELGLGLGGWIIGLKVYNRIVGSNSEVELESVTPQAAVVVLFDEAGQELIAGFASQMHGQSFENQRQVAMLSLQWIVNGWKKKNPFAQAVV